MKTLLKLESHIPFPALYTPLYFWAVKVYILTRPRWLCFARSRADFKDKFTTTVIDSLKDSLSGIYDKYNPSVNMDKWLLEFLDPPATRCARSFIERKGGNQVVGKVKWQKGYNPFKIVNVGMHCLTDESIDAIPNLGDELKWGNVIIIDQNLGTGREEIMLLSMNKDLGNAETLIEQLVDKSTINRNITCIEVIACQIDSPDFNCTVTANPKCLRGNLNKQRDIRDDKRFYWDLSTSEEHHDVLIQNRLGGYILAMFLILLISYGVSLVLGMSAKPFMIGAFSSWLVSVLMVEVARKLKRKKPVIEFQI